MSKKLVFIQNDQALTTSLKVAETFEKEHFNVMRDIRDLLKQIGDSSKLNSPLFEESTYINQQNKQQPMYLMNRDGFTLLAMGFTGKKALKFKLAYIDAFNKMQKKLAELLAAGKDAIWVETSKNTTLNRKSETAVIKNFIDYARPQGFKDDDKKIYSKFSIWANIIAGLPMRNGRGNATVQQLNMVGLAENGIKHILIDGMADGLHYAQIIAQVEKWLDKFQKISFADSYINSVPLIG